MGVTCALIRLLVKSNGVAPRNVPLAVPVSWQVPSGFSVISASGADAFQRLVSSAGLPTRSISAKPSWMASVLNLMVGKPGGMALAQPRQAIVPGPVMVTTRSSDWSSSCSVTVSPKKSNTSTPLYHTCHRFSKSISAVPPEPSPSLEENTGSSRFMVMVPAPLSFSTLENCSVVHRGSTASSVWKSAWDSTTTSHPLPGTTVCTEGRDDGTDSVPISAGIRLVGILSVTRAAPARAANQPASHP